MRIFEKLLIIVSFTLSLPFRKLILNDNIAINVIVIALISSIFLLHLFLEGTRWQMYPVYIVSVVVMILLITSYGMTSLWFEMMISIVSLVLIVVSITLCIILPIFQLPQMSKEKSIGATYLTFKDGERDNRTINLKIWYPSFAIKNLLKMPIIRHLQNH